MEQLRQIVDRAMKTATACNDERGDDSADDMGLLFVCVRVCV
jgi:hypothetical protein